MIIILFFISLFIIFITSLIRSDLLYNKYASIKLNRLQELNTIIKLLKIDIYNTEKYINENIFKDIDEDKYLSYGIKLIELEKYNNEYFEIEKWLRFHRIGLKHLLSEITGNINI